MVDRLYDGLGKCYLANGIIYEGQFKKGKPDGPGKYSQNFGEITKCEFKDGKKHGI